MEGVFGVLFQILGILVIGSIIIGIGIAILKIVKSVIQVVMGLVIVMLIGGLAISLLQVEVVPDDAATGQTTTVTATRVVRTSPTATRPSQAVQVEGEENEPTRPAALPSWATMTNARYLNVRSGPGVHYSKVTTLKRGDRVQLSGPSEEVDDQTWVQIVVDGQEGWVNQSYLDIR